MSETPPPIAEKSSPEASLPRSPKSAETIRALIIAGIALLLMAVLWWSGNMRARQAEAAAYTRMGEAVAQSMAPHYLNRNWRKTEQELTKMAQAGNFSEITLIDNEGRVVASTTRTPANPESLKNAPNSARVSMEGGSIRIESKVWLAEGNPLGAVRILVRR